MHHGGFARGERQQDEKQRLDGCVAGRGSQHGRFGGGGATSMTIGRKQLTVRISES